MLACQKVTFSMCVTLIDYMNSLTMYSTCDMHGFGLLAARLLADIEIDGILG
jgi:hypothetical protein